VSVGVGRWAKPVTYATYDYRPPSSSDEDLLHLAMKTPYGRLKVSEFNRHYYLILLSPT
jgi:hypothetical protein